MIEWHDIFTSASGWSLASGLGLAGFALSLHNWWGLRPDVFLTFNVRQYDLWEEGVHPRTAQLEVHNAGSAGITVSAITVDPDDGEPRWPTVRPQSVLTGGPASPRG